MLSSNEKTIESAVLDFKKISAWAPFRFGGEWYVCKTVDGFLAFRTKKAAVRNTISPQDIWKIKI